MTRRLTIKKEIRTLGLDLCNPRRLVGAVVRGGVYLDGVLVFPSNPIPESRSIASAILETRFFPELRLIIPSWREGIAGKEFPTARDPSGSTLHNLDNWNAS